MENENENENVAWRMGGCLEYMGMYKNAYRMDTIFVIRN